MIMTRKELRDLKDRIRRRDGDVCYIDKCQTGTEYRTQHKRDFDLEHRDNNKNNFELSNLGLAAHSCNIRKAHAYRAELRRKKLDVKLNDTTQHKLLYLRERGRGGESVCVLGTDRIEHNHQIDADLSRMSAEMKKSERFFPVFEKYIIERVSREGKSDYEDTLYSACYKSGVKEKTGRAWIKILSSSCGPVAVIKENGEPRYIVLRHLNLSTGESAA